MSLEGSQDYQHWNEDSEAYQERKKEKQDEKDVKACTRIKGPVYRKEDSEKDELIHSSRDFWQDIEPNIKKETKLLDMSNLN